MRRFQPCVHRTRGRSHTNHHFRQIAEYGTARAYDGSFADGDTRRNEYVRGNPDLIFDHDGKCLYVKTRRLVVMRTRAQITFLRNDGVCAYCNSCKTIKDGVVADPRMIADLQFPRVGNLDAGSHNDALTDLRSEATQQPSPKSVHHLRRCPEQSRLHQPPQLHCESRAAPEIWRQAKGL